MPQCPYPKYIVDEATGLELENNMYRAWAKGYAQGYADGQIKVLKELTQDELLLKGIENFEHMIGQKKG